jgi:hypothetical protein
MFRIDGDYFPKQHWHVGLYNVDEVCFLWGSKWIFKYYSCFKALMISDPSCVRRSYPQLMRKKGLLSDHINSKRRSHGLASLTVPTSMPRGLVFAKKTRNWSTRDCQPLAVNADATVVQCCFEADNAECWSEGSLSRGRGIVTLHNLHISRSSYANCPNSSSFLGQNIFTSILFSDA